MIGVFDSGHGGLTILRQLAAIPNRSFIYFGDHAHMPYGERTSEEIVALTRDAVEHLFARGCRLVILACNTAAAVALRTLQQEWLPQRYPDRRILGVLVPTVEAVTGVAWSGATASPRRAAAARRIGVFATRRTVHSNAYVEEIGKRAPEIEVIQHACTGLVDLIERSAPQDQLRAAVQGHVAALMARLGEQRLDAVLLGCTHYPLVADLFAEALPPGLTILSQPQLVAQSLGDYLRRHPERDVVCESPTLTFLTTGDPVRAGLFATNFFGKPARFIAALP